MRMDVLSFNQNQAFFLTQYFMAKEDYLKYNKGIPKQSDFCLDYGMFDRSVFFTVMEGDITN